MPDPTKRKADAVLRLCHLMYGRGFFSANDVIEMLGISMTTCCVYMRHAVEFGAGAYNVQLKCVDGVKYWKVSKAAGIRQVMMHSLATTKPMSLTGGRHA